MDNVLSYLRWPTRGMKTESVESFRMRNFVVCTVYLLQSGWLNVKYILIFDTSQLDGRIKCQKLSSKSPCQNKTYIAIKTIPKTIGVTLI